MSVDEQRLIAADNLDTLKAGEALRIVLGTEGWQRLYARRVAILEQARTLIRKIDTGDAAVAVDALRRWQIAENFIEEEADYINETLQRAETIRASVTLDDALLMEKMKHEQPESREPSSADRGGY